jgi:phosphoglycolate phosphatase
VVRVSAGRLVVFDLDGTLIDSVADLATALNHTLKELDPSTRPLPLDRVRTFVGEGARVLVDRSLEAVSLDVPVDRALAVFMRHYADHLLDATRPYPGIPELLQRLNGRLAVLTNKPGEMSRRILDGLGLAQHFFAIYGGDDLPWRKPDPRGLVRLVEESSIARDQAVLVGDSAIDVRTARGAGVRVIGVTWGLAPESLEAEPPDELARDAAELERLLGN